MCFVLFFVSNHLLGSYASYFDVFIEPEVQDSIQPEMITKRPDTPKLSSWRVILSVAQKSLQIYNTNTKDFFVSNNINSTKQHI